MVETGSSIPRRQLGRYLRQARDEAGVTMEAAAQELEWSRAKMYRIEGGQAPVRKHDVLAMCSVYGAPPELTEALVALSLESKSRGWWHAYGDAVPAWFELYVGLESAASRLRQYESGLVPGLLQTREYAAAVQRTRAGATEEGVAQAVEVRMERQKLLARRRPAAPRLEVIVDEAVLRRTIPDAEGMRLQLAHLANSIREPDVIVRVLPLSAGPHRASLAGSFVILDFAAVGARAAEPTTVYSESMTGALYLDKPGEVATYADAWEALCALALSVRESESLIATVIKESYDA